MGGGLERWGRASTVYATFFFVKQFRSVNHNINNCIQTKNKSNWTATYLALYGGNDNWCGPLLKQQQLQRTLVVLSSAIELDHELSPRQSALPRKPQVISASRQVGSAGRQAELWGFLYTKKGGCPDWPECGGPYRRINSQTVKMLFVCVAVGDGAAKISAGRATGVSPSGQSPIGP